MIQLLRVRAKGVCSYLYHEISAEVLRSQRPCTKLKSCIDGFHRFTSGGQESGCAFGAVVCKIQAMKHYIKSLPLVKH